MATLSIYDLITPQNVTAYWLTRNKNAQPLLGETLFPTVHELGLDISWLKGSNGQPVALKLSAFDSKSIRRDREGFAEYRTKMPFFKESMYIDEEMRQKLNTVIATNNNLVLNTVLDRIFADLAKLLDAAQITLERMRMEAVTTGTITLASNGQAYTYDFEVPTDQKITVSTSWSDASADIIGDITDFVDAMKAKGVTITKAICNNSVAKYIRQNTAIKNQIYVLAGGNISNVGVSQALNFIYQETGVEFYVYDNVYVDETDTAVKYVPDDTVCFLPDGTLGATHMGVTPEASDLTTGASSDTQVEVMSSGITVTTHREFDPVNVDTKVSMIALPSLDRADEIGIMDVVK